jgi:hypothetical protein
MTAQTLSASRAFAPHPGATGFARGSALGNDDRILSVAIEDSELRRLAAEWVRRTTAEQGLPEYVEDEDTLETIAAILMAGAESVHAASQRNGPNRKTLRLRRSVLGSPR